VEYGATKPANQKKYSFHFYPLLYEQLSVRMAESKKFQAGGLESIETAGSNMVFCSPPFSLGSSIY
jgi:hypothetical protein